MRSLGDIQNILKPILMNKYSHKGFFMKIFFIPTHSSSLDQVKVSVSAMERTRRDFKKYNPIFLFFFI